MIALIDYGAGNLRSVYKALRFINAKVEVFDQPEGLNAAAAMVLPGVGAFDDCIRSLERRHLVGPVQEFIRSDRPFLGICVGYQALFQRSEEFDSRAQGLGVFEGPVVRFSRETELKVPQIGWNQVLFTRSECPLFKGIRSGSHFYFVHSYFPRPDDTEIVVGNTDYGESFASAVWKNNVFATQFHPEKSQHTGLRLLQNFCNLVPA